MKGTVFLVGAGPGDIGLITKRGLELLQSCDCVVYDALVGASLPPYARPDAEMIFVGKRAGHHSMTQDEINALLIEKANEGKSICRLKGGDPFVFGRGGEEALACLENQVPFEIVPGVTSSIAAPAYAGIPVTHREIATSFAVVTGHTASDDAPPEAIPRADTLVFLMGVKALPLIVKRLLERGESPTTPVALVRWGTTSKQQTVVGTLQNIEAEVESARLKSPALIVVGNVVNLREKLRWFDNRPLWGKNVVVTRAREQASSLVVGLEKLGANVIQCPTIKIENLEEFEILDESITKLNSFDWVIFTSTNGVEQFWKRLRHFGLDSRSFGSAQIGAIGPATVASLEARGLFADFVPESSISESVAQGLVELGVEGKKILVVRAQEGREILKQEFEKAGAIVTVAPCYRTVPDNSNASLCRELLEKREIDWVCFTSSSTVKNFVDAVGAEFVGEHRDQFRVAVIGPITAESSEKMGLKADVMAQEATVESLAEALTSTK